MYIYDISNLRVNTGAALSSEKNSGSLNRRLIGSQSCSGRFAEENNLLTLVGFEPWTVQYVA